MKRNVSIIIGLLLSMALPISVAAQEEGDTGFAAALASGEATLSGRYRFEHVDQDNPLDNANASTLRLRLNYRTGRWNGWSGFVEFDHVFHMLIDDFNSGQGTSPNRSDYSVVADPSGSDLNQAYFDLKTNDTWSLRVGRQRIIFDNHRFIGSVGWRQNEQTYDALTVNTSAISKTKLTYSYVNRVRRIFGQTVAAGRARVDGHLLNARIDLSDNFAVTPYYYFLDYSVALANSTSTAGIRLTGNLEAGDGKIGLLGEFATQSDAGDNPVSYDADYLHLNGSWTFSNGLSLGVGFESLGADSGAGVAFRTPLATLHAMNGWADQFLATPAAGLEDSYASVKFKAGKWNLTGVLHDFASEIGSSDYGTEIDVSAARKLNGRYGLLLKGAFFSADGSSPLTNVDTNKFWIMLTASY